MLAIAIPIFFVFLWSTGFIGARFGLPFAEPMSFLAVRMVLNLLCLGVLVMLFRAPRATLRDIGHMLVVGILLHGIYLGGVFIAIDLGTPTGVTALLVGLQPLLTALFAFLASNYRPDRFQLCGLFMGVIGIVLVLWTPLGSGSDFTISLRGISFALLALLGITFGTLYQKRFCHQHPLLLSTFWQYTGALLLFGPASLLLDSEPIQWTLTFSLALAWSVIVLSVIAILLLMLIIRHGEIHRVTSLFFLVPPATALQGYLWFDEQLSTQVMIGGVTTILSVILVSYRAGIAKSVSAGTPDNDTEKR